MAGLPLPGRRRAVLAAVLAAVVFGAPRAARAQAPDHDVRLVVVIVVDQLRADLVTRYARHFAPDGFTRLMREGAHFINAYFSFGSSATAPGHATIATGRLPRQHGVVGNKWYLDPSLSRSQYAVEDPRSALVGLEGAPPPEGKSPWRLIGPALGDQMKLTDSRSRVFSVAMKDRAAIFLGGRLPDGAYWWDDRFGRAVSSTWYCRALPDYLNKFNNEKWADRYSGQVWNPLLPPETYAGCRPVEAEWIFEGYGFGHVFPHKLPERTDANPAAFYATLSATPMGNEIVLEMARRVLVEEKLGAGPAPDALFIGLSSNDMCGHVFGPESPEVMDLTLRTDRQLGQLLEWFDKQVGLRQCLVAVVGDHGVSSIPQQVARLRLDGNLTDLSRAALDLNNTIKRVHGSVIGDRKPVIGINLPWVYLDPAIRAFDADLRRQILDLCAGHFRSQEGVLDAFSSIELEGPPPSRDDLHRWLAWRGYHPGRAGDVYVQLKPGWYKKGDNTAGHCASFTHDRHVPILLMGPRVRPGRYFAPADPADIPVTLAALLGIEPPIEAVGRILHEAIDTAPPGEARQTEK